MRSSVLSSPLVVDVGKSARRHSFGALICGAERGTRAHPFHVARGRSSARTPAPTCIPISMYRKSNFVQSFMLISWPCSECMYGGRYVGSTPLAMHARFKFTSLNHFVHACVSVRRRRRRRRRQTYTHTYTHSHWNTGSPIYYPMGFPGDRRVRHPHTHSVGPSFGCRFRGLQIVQIPKYMYTSTYGLFSSLGFVSGVVVW